MRKIQKFSGALVIAAMMASAVTVFSTPAYASTFGGSKPTPTICSLLASAYTFVSTLPDSSLKTYLLNSIKAQELAYKCAA